MNTAEAEAYLTRIGYDGARAPTIKTLRALHRAHLTAVPFENLDIHLGRPIVLDPDAFFRKIVGERRGGFCYELNGLFGELLRFLGFEVSLLSGRVALDAGGFGLEFDHLVLRVRVDDGTRWLADVGFGRSFHEPLSLDLPRTEDAEGLSYRAVDQGAEWHVEARTPSGELRPQYAFTLAPRELASFAGMCAFHQTSPESHFTRKAVCSRLGARGRTTLSGDTLIEVLGEVRRETPIEAGAREEVLARCFGVHLPPGSCSERAP